MIIIYLSLIVLTILPVFQTGFLSWRELLRLLIILVGIVILYNRNYSLYKKALVEDNEKGFLEIRKRRDSQINQVSYFTCILFIYIFSQFNPTVIENPIEIQNVRFNSLFLISAAAVITAFVFFILYFIKFKKTNREESVALKFSFLDKFFLILITVIIIMGITSKLFLSKNPQWREYGIGLFRLVFFILIWFLIRFLFRIGFNDKTDISFMKPAWLRRIYIVVFLSFFTALVIGCVKFVSIAYTYNTGKNSFTREEYVHALRQLQDTIAKNLYFDFKPIGNKAMEMTAIIYAGMDSISRFEEEIQKIREYNKGDERINGRIGRIYYTSQKYNKAKDEFEIYLSRNFYNAEIISMLGEIYIRSKNTTGIMRLLQEYHYNPLEYGLKNSEDFIFLGNAYIELLEYNKAMSVFRQASSLEPDNPYIYYKMGRIFSYLKNYENAIQRYSQAVEFDPEFADAFYRWGESLENLGRNDQALEKFRKTVSLLPNHYDGLKKLIEYSKEK